MPRGYAHSDYDDWFSATLLAITKSPFTIFNGAVAPSLTPLTTFPTVDFKLGFLATSTGTVTVTGSLDGVARVETLTLAATQDRRGTYTFDTIATIACTCATGTIVVSCYDTIGRKLENDTGREIACAWYDHGSPYWNAAGVFTAPTAEAYLLDRTLVIGDQIRFDTANIHDPTNGRLYIIQNIQIAIDEDGLIPINVLKF